MFTNIRRPVKGISTCPRFTYCGVEFQPRLGSCLKENLAGGTWPPGIEVLWRSAPYASYASDCPVIRAALDALAEGVTPVATPELIAACDEQIRLHPNVYQMDGPASGELSLSSPTV